MFLKMTRNTDQSGKSVMPPARLGLIVIVGLIVVSWVIASVGVGL